MIDISLEKNRSLYEDWKACVEWLKNFEDTSYTYPSEKTYFHLYSEIKTEKELLAVKSFFATQNLEKCNLVLWSDYNVVENPLLAPYRAWIDFRIFDPVMEAKGTILEGNLRHLQASDSLHYMKSGLLRFLMPHKMGGIWYDMDMVLLRDFKAILDQEFAYMWGTVTDFSGFGPCAALMGIHKGSQHSTICLEELIRAPIIPNTVCRDHQLLAKVFQRRPFSVFPSVFFNTEWQMDAPEGALDQRGWFIKNEHSNKLFLEAFAWHWHNSSNKDKPIEPESKFYLLNKLTDENLKKRGIL